MTRRRDVRFRVPASRSPARAVAWMSLGVLLLAPASPLSGQSLGITKDCEAPSWVRNWSPLAHRGDLPRSLPGLTSCGPRLFWGAPRTGVFWTGGNPAAAPGEMDDRRTDFLGGWASQRGSYRRPLDPPQTSLLQVRASGWSALPGGAFIGRALVDQEQVDPGTAADAAHPFSSSPFVLTDTSEAAVKRNRVLLEGGGGWRLGDWGLGLALGYESLDSRTVVSGLTRNVRTTAPGVSAGAVRRVGSVTVGAHGRWLGRTETTQLIEVAANGEVHDLRGYQEVTGTAIAGAYYRRTDADAWAAGVDVGYTRPRLTVAATVEATRLALRQWRAEQNDPPADRWETSGWRATVALSRPLNEAITLAAEARYERLTGTAEEASEEPTGVTFTAAEHMFDGQLSLWLHPAAREGWVGALVIGFQQEQRVRADSVAQLRTDIRALNPWVDVELARHLGPVLLGSAIGLHSYGPTSSIPTPGRRGPTYTRYLAKEIGLYSADALTVGLTAFARWRVGPGRQLWLAGHFERISPAGGLAFRFDVPEGSRSAASLRFGVTLAP